MTKKGRFRQFSLSLMTASNVIGKRGDKEVDFKRGGRARPIFAMFYYFRIFS
jgi:hypothetical protein